MDHMTPLLIVLFLCILFVMSASGISVPESVNSVSPPTETEEVLALPEPTSIGTSDQLELNGPALKLDKLGPIIVNSDGTTQRINNWQELSKQEQDSAWRIIAKRNKERVEYLKNQQKLQEQKLEQDQQEQQQQEHQQPKGDEL